MQPTSESPAASIATEVRKRASAGGRKRNSRTTTEAKDGFGRLGAERSADVDRVIRGFSEEKPESASGQFFRRHPEIAAGSSAFGAEDLRVLDAEAAARHVELVPCLQSLGHMERILSLARYRDLDESGGGWTLSPADPGSYALLRDLFDEYLPNFRSPLFNANCDEPWDLGRGRSRRRAESVGRGRLFLEPGADPIESLLQRAHACSFTGA